jgi:hypothetical protein
MLAGIVTDLTDWLDRISSHWWFLASPPAKATRAC